MEFLWKQWSGEVFVYLYRKASSNAPIVLLHLQQNVNSKMSSCKPKHVVAMFFKCIFYIKKDVLDYKFTVYSRI